MSQIWSLENKFEYFFKVELALLRAYEDTRVPRGTADKVKNLHQLISNG